MPEHGPNPENAYNKSQLEGERENTHLVASVVLVNPGGLLIFQERDNKPGILNPGMITPWGGAVEEDEDVLAAAKREIKEELDMDVEKSDFSQFGVFERGYEIDGRPVVNYVFLLEGVDQNSLVVLEGAGFRLIDPQLSADDPSYTPLTRELIAKYAEALERE